MNTDVSALLRNALDQLPNGIVVLDDQNKLAFANKSALLLQDTCPNCLTWGASSTPTRIPLTDDAVCQLGTLVLTGDVSVTDRSCNRRSIAGKCASITESAVIAGLERVVACLELRDPHTKGHSDRVKDLAVAMARRTLRNFAILPVLALSHSAMRGSIIHTGATVLISSPEAQSRSTRSALNGTQLTVSISTTAPRLPSQ